jgi:hypothetical protein
MEGKKYEEMKKLEKSHIRERSSIQWRDASVATNYVEENIQAMQERQNQYNDLVESLNGDLSLIESQNQQALVDQEITFLNQLRDVEYEMTLSTEEMFRQQNASFDAMIREVQQSYRAEMDEVHDAISLINADLQEKDQLGIRAIEDADRLYEWIRSSYDWEFFIPGEMREIEYRIDTATENYYQGLAETTVAQAQGIQLDLEKTRAILEKKVSQWNFLRGMIDQRIYQLLNVIEEIREVQPVDLEMNIIADAAPLDVDYWSEGKLTEIEEKLAHLQRLVQNDHCNLEIDEMRSWMEKLDEKVDERLSGIIMLARYNALDGQIRRNLATIAADVMAANGFKVVEYSDDPLAIQEPFFVLMRDDHGGEITIDIAPDEGYINQISIQMSESTPVMEFQLENQRREVIDALNRRGVGVERLDRPIAASRFHLDRTERMIAVSDTLTLEQDQVDDAL